MADDLLFMQPTPFQDFFSRYLSSPVVGKTKYLPLYKTVEGHIPQWLSAIPHSLTQR